MKKKIIITCSTLGATLLLGFIICYFGLPAFTIQNFGFVFLLSLLVGLIASLVLVWLSDKMMENDKKKGKDFYFTKKMNKSTGKFDKISQPIEKKYTVGNCFAKGMVGAVGFVLIISALIGIVGTPLFNAKKYSRQITIEQGTEEEFANEFNFDGDLKLPILDKALAFKQAQAKLSTYGAQYSIDDENFTILSVTRNGEDQLVRVTPLEYSDVFVAMNKKDKGSIGYIEVNVVTKETRLVEVPGGMKYLPSGVFSKDLDRHIRFKYPNALFNKKYFEIDDDGKPYWVIPTYKNEVTIYNGATPTGTILCDPVTGETHRYAMGEEPRWVDRVCVDSLIEKQTTNALRYNNGFFNTVFGSKKDVFQLSDGYNYFIKNGHTYYVSCITSPNEEDQTSIGFATIDLKTREAKEFFIPGITEMRAREIAMQHEDVKAQQLDATWPILIDYKGVPTYFLVLKNDVQDRKVVFINVETGTSIAMGSTLDEAKLNYDKLINQGSITTDETKELTAKVTRTQIFGDDIYFMVEGIENKYFVVSSKLSLDAMFLKENDNVKITYVEYDTYNYVKTLERVA